MIDIVDPDEPYNVARYREGALGAIVEINGRGKVPILAGGTPLYVNVVTQGWTIPAVEPDLDLRAHLEREVAKYGPETLHERLRSVDPAAAQRILPSNSRRIIRALEVALSTGTPISEQQAKLGTEFHHLTIGLRCERAELYRRVDARVDSQIARGLVKEVVTLHERGYSYELPSTSGLGYRQVGDYLRGRATLPEAIQRIKWDTHAFVRHQENWFRRDSDAVWLDVTHEPPEDRALALAQRFLTVPA
jgi:tRNA dimethylallyltransferase